MAMSPVAIYVLCKLLVIAARFDCQIHKSPLSFSGGYPPMTQKTDDI